MLSEIFGLLSERREFFLNLILEHILISSAVILIAIFLGVLIGIFISEYRRAATPTLNVVNFLYTIPSISMLGFLILFFGVGNTAAVVALSIYALLPIVRNTYTGLIHIDKGLVEAAEALALNRRQILFHVKLPLAMPVIMSGVRNMAIMTISLAGIASFIGAGGLGVAIYRGITTNNGVMTLAGSLLIALMALVTDFFIGIAEKRIAEHKKIISKFTLTLAAGATCLCIAYGIFSAGVENKNVIRVATKPMTEQYIMGEMLKILIERDTNLEVEIISGVGGGTSNIMPAMEKGEFDIYPEYTGTAWNMVLKRQDIYDESKFDNLTAAYHKNYNMRWLGMYGFNDTYGLIVRKEIAEEYGIKNFSDLQKISAQLTFGAEYDFFEREDGYNALCKAYNLNFAKTMDLDIGLKYKALANNQVDAMIVFTTDGQLAKANAVVLVDDKNFFPSYICGNIVREEVLQKYPELELTLNKFTNSVTDIEMAAMNYQVESEGIDARTVAENFIALKNL